MLKVYVACKMTGLKNKDLIIKARKDCADLLKHEIFPHHPVIMEAIPENEEMLPERSEVEMKQLWGNDKIAVKTVDVVIDTAPHVHSTGASKEIGKARFRDWTPTVAVWPEGSKIPFIAREEYDICVNSMDEAGYLIQEHWGTRWKRMKWRFGIYLSHWNEISVRKIFRFFR